MKPLLSVRDLRAPAVAVEHLDLLAGDCLAIMGASGAGKSRFLRAIADLDPSEGEVSLAGRSRWDFEGPKWRQEVVFLPANVAWWDSQVALHFGAQRPLRSDLEGLLLPADALDMETAKLSTGQSQRLGLLRALALKPRVLLLDESTSGLDRESRDAVERRLKGFLEDGGAMLLVTHDQDQALRMASAIWQVAEGRLEPAP